MTTQHTPGPWGIEQFKTGAIFIESGTVCEIARIGLPVSNGESIETCLANARLIAAAPGLLEACKEATFYLRNLPSLPRTNPVADKLEAAIAKAEKGGAL